MPFLGGETGFLFKANKGKKTNKKNRIRRV